MEFPLCGDLVQLVPMRPEHIKPLLAAAQTGGDTFRYTWVPTDLAGMTAYVDDGVRDTETGVSISLVLLNSGGDVVGSSRFRNIEHWPATATRPAVTVAEIGGTWLAAHAQRTGINPESKLLMLDYAFEHLDAVRVSFMTDARNERSRRSIESTGASFDGVLRAHMPAFDGGIRDSAFYSIVQTDWPALRVPLRRRIRGLVGKPAI